MDDKYNKRYYSSKMKAYCASLSIKQMLSWESFSVRLLSVCFTDRIVPFTEIKGSLHHFPTQSVMEPSRDYH